MKTIFIAVFASCLALDISAEVWKSTDGKSAGVFLSMNMDELKKQCESKKMNVRDPKLYEAYFKRFKEIQEDIIKKRKTDPNLNLEKLINEQCIVNPTMKTQVENITSTIQRCLEEKDRLDQTRKNNMIKKILDIKCASLKKILTVRAEEKCIKPDPSTCIQRISKVTESLIPIPVTYSATECREFRKIFECKNAMKECKEETKKAFESFATEEMALVRCSPTER